VIARETLLDVRCGAYVSNRLPIEMAFEPVDPSYPGWLAASRDSGTRDGEEEPEAGGHRLSAHAHGFPWATAFRNIPGLGSWHQADDSCASANNPAIGEKHALEENCRIPARTSPR
jgi:hypothetical protein